MNQLFLWDAWNRGHIAPHSVSENEAEAVVRGSKPPFPRRLGDEKRLVWGRTPAGRYLQVIYIVRTADQIDYESMSFEDIIGLGDSDIPLVYVIHARGLTAKEKSQYKRAL